MVTVRLLGVAAVVHVSCDAGGLNYPYRGHKTTLWEGGLKGISWILAPGLKPGRYANLMHVTDWLPTLAEAVGGPQQRHTLRSTGVLCRQALHRSVLHRSVHLRGHLCRTRRGNTGYDTDTE